MAFDLGVLLKATVALPMFRFTDTTCASTVTVTFFLLKKQLELSPAITRSLIGWKRVLYDSSESIKNGAKAVTSSANSLFWKLESNAWGI